MQKTISFDNGNGISLSGVLSDPKSRSIAILCHGLGSKKHSKTLLALEETLNSKGIATFRFDFYGHGESEGSFEDLTLTEAINNILRAIALFKEKYQKICLYGSSFGGLASLFAAAKTNCLSALALRSPVLRDLGEKLLKFHNYSKERWARESLKFNKHILKFSFYLDVQNYNAFELVQYLDLPILIVQGDKDELLPLEEAKQFAKSLPNCKLEIIHGANHIYSEQAHFAKMLNLICDFIVKHLQ